MIAFVGYMNGIGTWENNFGGLTNFSVVFPSRFFAKQVYVVHVYHDERVHSKMMEQTQFTSVNRQGEGMGSPCHSATLLQGQNCHDRW